MIFQRSRIDSGNEGRVNGSKKGENEYGRKINSKRTTEFWKERSRLKETRGGVVENEKRRWEKFAS